MCTCARFPAPFASVRSASSLKVLVYLDDHRRKHSRRQRVFVCLLCAVRLGRRRRFMYSVRGLCTLRSSVVDARSRLGVFCQTLNIEYCAVRCCCCCRYSATAACLLLMSLLWCKLLCIACMCSTMCLLPDVLCLCVVLCACVTWCMGMHTLEARAREKLYHHQVVHGLGRFSNR